MSEIRWDLVKKKWVAVAANQALKPHDFPIARMALEASGKPGFCPFCEGNEAFTPPEICAYRNNSETDGKGWLVRVIPNKFAAFALEGVLEKSNSGIHTFCNGLGKHEVIIENPQHGVEFHDLSLERIEIILNIFKERYQHLSKDERIKYIQIYKNRGMFGGASLDHNHCQIVALPFVPQENSGLPEYFQQNSRCLLCDIMKEEMAAGERVVLETDHFVLICPYAPRFPYETWIIPKRHCEHYSFIDDKETKDLALVLKNYIKVIIDNVNNPSYNLVINTAPVNTENEKGYHWYMEITPRLLVNAGVEVATGIYINPVAPELAAQMLREKCQQLF